jgi:hypothetical protein
MVRARFLDFRLGGLIARVFGTAATQNGKRTFATLPAGGARSTWQRFSTAAMLTKSGGPPHSLSMAVNIAAAPAVEATESPALGS